MTGDSTQRTYPAGVPCWIDTDQPDLEAAKRFYGELFGWSFTRATPPSAPFTYEIATLDGQDVGGLGSGERAGGEVVWNTYVAVDDADATAEQVTAAGGQLVSAPADAGEGGRGASFRDPSGTEFHVWQAKRRLGSQIANVPGAWNFTDLHTDDPAQIRFYSDLFGWQVDELGFATLVRRPGYGDHLASTVDPGIRERQDGIAAPPGFEDAIAWVAPAEAGLAAHWHVSFAVADRDETADLAQRLGATVVSSDDTEWTRTALIRDPQGATFTASQFTPPE